MQGYLGKPELATDAIRHGWLHTGDLARCDERGYYWIVDRKKYLIVTGGFNIYPREVEDAISADSAVSQVAVIGTPDPKWGEAVTAVVECRPGVEIDRDTLVGRLKDRVRAQKGAVHVPKHIAFMDELPRTPVGKIDKKALRQPYWADQQRQVN